MSVEPKKYKKIGTFIRRTVIIFKCDVECILVTQKFSRMISNCTGRYQRVLLLPIPQTKVHLQKSTKTDGGTEITDIQLH